MKTLFGTLTTYSSILVVASLISSPASAQVSANATETDLEQEPRQILEEVVVTGSRIARSNLTTTTPVNIIDAEAIELSGAINTAELLNALPASGAATYSSTTSNFDINNSGVNTIELRNLGEDRTLVLVNGRRFVAGVAGTQAVDFNSIPTDFVERIDVVTGGASAVYGSDALAGVINIVLREDFEGFEVSVQGGRTDRGDDETYNLAATGGFNFADNRGNAMASVSYDKERGVYARHRSGLEVDGYNLAEETRDPEDYDQLFAPYYSSFNEAGRILVPNRTVEAGSADLVVNPDGSVRPYDGDTDGFNRQSFRALAVPSERVLFSSVVNFEINDQVNWFFESTYAGTQSNAQLEPVPLGSADVFGDNEAQCFDDDGDGDNDRCAYGVSVLSPYIPAGVREAAVEANPTVPVEDLVVGFARRTTELDPRGSDNLRQTARVVTGINGTLLDRFNYEASVNYGRTTQEQKSPGQINVLNMRYALDVIEDDNGDIICRDEIARLQGCLPVNLFGEGSITAGLSVEDRTALLRYLQANSNLSATVEQAIFSAFVAGPIFDLPAGPLQASIGTEYRDERSEQVADGLTQQGLNGGNISPPTVGQFNVAEIFGEASIPIISDKFMAESLELDLAFRWSDYSTVGTTNAFAVSSRYAPIDDVLVRAQYARAVRAPNIAELYDPLGETFEGGVDPCEGVTLTADGTAAFLTERRNISNPQGAFDSGIDSATIGDGTAAACLADPLVAARVAETGGLVLTQAEIQGVGGFNGGAAAGGTTLTEETADTYVLGVTWDPSFNSAWDPFSLTLDYFDIKVEDAIGVVERQDSLSNCYSAVGFDPDSAFCGNIVRYDSGPFTGALRELNALTQNIAAIETAGVDMQLDYTFDVGNFGTVRTNLTYTKLLKYDFVPFPGAAVIDEKGEVGYAEDKAVLGVIWGGDRGSVAVTTEYFGSSALTNDSTDEYYYGPEVGSRYFVDLQGRYQLIEGLEIFAGIDNVFDEFVVIEQGGPGVPTGWNTRPDVYDSLGKRYYAGVKWRL